MIGGPPVVLSDSRNWYELKAFIQHSLKGLGISLSSVFSLPGKSPQVLLEKAREMFTLCSCSSRAEAFLKDGQCVLHSQGCRWINQLKPGCQAMPCNYHGGFSPDFFFFLARARKCFWFLFCFICLIGYINQVRLLWPPLIKLFRALQHEISPHTETAEHYRDLPT